MPADFIIQTEHQTVFSYGWDTFTFADVKEHRNRLLHDVSFDRRFRQVANLVDATLTASGVTLHTVSSEAGLYVFPSMPPGVYTVTAAKTGFKKLVRPEIQIFIAQRQALDLPMEVAVKAFDEIRQLHGLGPANRDEG